MHSLLFLHCPLNLLPNLFDLSFVLLFQSVYVRDVLGYLVCEGLFVSLDGFLQLQLVSLLLVVDLEGVLHDDLSHVEVVVLCKLRSHKGLVLPTLLQGVFQNGYVLIILLLCVRYNSL